MLAYQRQEYICERVAKEGGIRVAEIVAELGVSEMTVRRDISELVAQGKVERVHGGAVAIERGPGIEEAPSPVGVVASLRNTMAEQAVERIQPGDSMIIAGGLCSIGISRQIAELPYFSSLTIVTNCVLSSNVLFEAAEDQRRAGAIRPEIIATGGDDISRNALVGQTTLDVINRLRVSWAFIDAVGASNAGGFSVASSAEAAVLRAMIRSARKTVVMVPSNAWNNDQVFTFAMYEHAATILTDNDPGEMITSEITRSGTPIEISIGASWASY